MYKKSSDAWKKVLELGMITHTYEWSEKDDAWIVRERTDEEKAECQRTRSELQHAHDDSLPNKSQKFYQQ